VETVETITDGGQGMSNTIRRDPTKRSIMQAAKYICQEVRFDARVEDFKKVENQLEQKKVWIREQRLAPGVTVINTYSGEEAVIKEIDERRQVLVLFGHERVFQGKKTTFNPLVFKSKNGVAK